jgi:hypothetical protein
MPWGMGIDWEVSVADAAGLFVECVLTAVLVVCLAGCGDPGPQPSPLPTPVARLRSDPIIDGFQGFGGFSVGKRT